MFLEIGLEVEKSVSEVTLAKSEQHWTIQGDWRDWQDWQGFSEITRHHLWPLARGCGNAAQPREALRDFAIRYF